MLFESGQIGSLTLRHRIVRSATAEGLADEAGVPCSQLAEMYAELGRGGAGLIITGHMGVHRTGKAHPGMTMVDAEAHVAPLAKLVAAAHAQKAVLAAQINHAGRQALAAPGGPMGPSNHPASPSRPATRAMTHEEISRMINAFARAAERTQRAGFDAVQIHAAHGYLLSQFLSPTANRRTDDWGGTWANRTRLLRRVVQAVRDTVGPSFPVLIKLGIQDAGSGDLMLEEGVRTVGHLHEWGVDAIEISVGMPDPTSRSRTDAAESRCEAIYREWAQAAQRVAQVPILLVGGIRSRAVMEEILVSGDAQFIALCRPLICEPDLPHRLVHGQVASSCISGNRCWPEAGQVGISCKCLGVKRPPSPPTR